MIRLSCALAFLAVVLAVAMVARPDAYTAFLCMFVGQPALLVAAALFIFNPVHGRPVHNHTGEEPSRKPGTRR